MTEIPEQLAVAGELLDAGTAPARRNPDIPLFVHDDRVLAGGPVGRIPRATPGTQEVPFLIEKSIDLFTYNVEV